MVCVGAYETNKFYCRGGTVGLESMPQKVRTQKLAQLYSNSKSSAKATRNRWRREGRVGWRSHGIANQRDTWLPRLIPIESLGKYTSHGQRAQSRVATHEATRKCAGSNHTLPSGLLMGQSHNAHLDTKPKSPQYSHCPLVEAQHPRIVCETSNATKTRHRYRTQECGHGAKQ